MKVDKGAPPEIGLKINTSVGCVGSRDIMRVTYPVGPDCQGQGSLVGDRLWCSWEANLSDESVKKILEGTSLYRVSLQLFVYVFFQESCHLICGQGGKRFPLP